MPSHLQPTAPARTPSSSAPAAPPASAAPAAPAAPAGSWVAAADLPVAGWWPAQSSLLLLRNGKLLLTGGEDAHRGPLSASWLYDPTAAAPTPTAPAQTDPTAAAPTPTAPAQTVPAAAAPAPTGPAQTAPATVGSAAAGGWAETGPMVVPRRLASVTGLEDGRVLVVGGLTGRPAGPERGTAAAEIYDPSSNTWTATGDLAVGRFAHSATLLPDGRVLVAGGNVIRSADSIHAVRSAELFDPGTGSWSPAEPMTDPRFGHVAVPFLDDRILFVGGAVVAGRGLYGALALCELFDPSTGKWTPTGNLGVARKGHQATRLLDGSVLVSGGDGRGLHSWDYERYSQPSTELFDPGRGSWSPVGELPVGRSHHRDILLPSGHVLHIGGTEDGTLGAGYRIASLYDPAAKTWSPAPSTAVGRFGFAAAFTTADSSGKVLIAGGLTRSGPATIDSASDVVTATAELYTP